LRPREPDLAREAVRFSRHLVGSVPTELILQRYVHAATVLFGGETSPALEFTRRHPWALPWLDAACGLRRPEDPLRKHLLVMTAILETTPDYADELLPRHARFWPLVCSLAWNALRAGLKIPPGVGLLLLAERRTE